MIEIAAAMGLVNLHALDRVIDANLRNYRIYQRDLADLPGITLLSFDESERNNYQYVVMEVGAECPVSRDQIIQALHAENILARKYFWPGCHKMQPYRELYPHAGLLLPNTEQVADRVVVLPTGTTVSEADAATICGILRSFIKG